MKRARVHRGRTTRALADVGDAALRFMRHVEAVHDGDDDDQVDADMFACQTCADLTADIARVAGRTLTDAELNRAIDRALTRDALRGDA